MRADLYLPVQSPKSPPGEGCCWPAKLCCFLQHAHAAHKSLKLQGQSPSDMLVKQDPHRGQVHFSCDAVYSMSHSSAPADVTQQCTRRFCSTKSTQAILASSSLHGTKAHTTCHLDTRCNATKKMMRLDSSATLVHSLPFDNTATTIHSSGIWK